MTPTFEIVTLSVCCDCLLFIANGDLPEPLDPEYWDEDDNFDPEDIHGEYGCWPSAAGWHLHAGATDEDGTEIEDDEFSSTRCEGCSSSLAGSRHPATAMRRNRGPEHGPLP